MRTYQRKFDLDLSLEVEQKRLEWAKPFDGGPIKAFFVPDMRFGREIVELAQRGDIELDNVTIDRNWDTNRWGFGEFYNDNRTAIHDFRLIYQNLENAMTSSDHFDVLVLPGVKGWGEWSEKTRKAILERVANGAGLVLVKPYVGKDEEGQALGAPELAEVSALINRFEEGYRGGGYPETDRSVLKRGAWQPKSAHYITRGVAFDQIPFQDLAYYPYEAAQGSDVLIQSDSGDPILAAKPYGRGRVVTAAWLPRNILPQHADLSGGGVFLSILGQGTQQSTTYNHLELFYALLLRAIAWAADREPKAAIESLSLSKDAARASLCGAPADAMLDMRVIDAWDEVVYNARGNAGEALALPAWLHELGGDYRADVFLKAGGNVLDWHSAALSYPRVARVTELSMDSDQYKSGDTVRVTAQVEGSGADIVLTLEDCYHRVLARQSFEGAGGAVTMEYALGDWPSINIWAFAEVWAGDKRLQRVRCKKALVSPGDNRFLKDFEAFMAASPRGHGDLWDLQREKAWEMGISGAHPGSNKMWVGSGAEGLGVYWYHRAPYVERKEKYITTRDKNNLVRVPCLNDPAFWDKNVSKITQTVRENRKYMPVSYYANDEGSLTCYTDEQDLCFCGHCMDGMQGWLKAKYGAIEALNERWGTNHVSWDQAVPDTFLEADARQNFASWGDHRLFMEHTFAKAYETIASTVKAQDPAGVIRMSGCQASTTYSGYDYYQLHKHIGYFEAYGVGNQYEYHRSFKQPGTIVGGWYGYGARGDTVKNALWNAMFHGLTLVSVFWEVSCINPDFTLYQGAQDMGDAFKEFRRTGLGKLLLYGTKRDNLGIAVHYSMPSIHASYTDGRHKAYEENRQGWLDVLEDLGYQYDFVATQQIEAGELLSRGFKLLVLPYSRALSDSEVAEIRAFVQRGGMVLADCQCALMDESLKSRDVPALDDLFDIRRYSRFQRPFNGAGADVKTVDFDYFALADVNSEKHESSMPLAEADVRTTTGKAALVQDFTRIIPSTVVNRFGEGFGVYLNATLNHYPKERADGVNSRIREVLARVIELSEVRRPLDILGEQGEPVRSGIERFYYEQGGARYVGLLRGFGRRMKIAYDGRETGDLQADGAAERYGIALDSPAHIYEVRLGQYLGFGTRAEVSLAPGQAAVIALLPYGPQGIDVQAPERAAPGEELRVRAALRSADESIAPVWNVQVFDPEGAFDVVLSRNESSPALDCALRLPYNAKAGLWHVLVRDVASGQAVECAIDVR